MAGSTVGHPNAGRKHSAEWIAKRTASNLATRTTWTAERRAEVAKINSVAHLGQIPWNKGRRWTDGLKPEEVRAIKAEWARRRRGRDPRRRIHERFSRLVAKYLKRHRSNKGGVPWVKLVGYTLEQLEARLRNTLPRGYSWQDFLDARLEIDHIVPVSAHNFSSPAHPDFRRCWALTNLRLLPKSENYEKRAKLLAPFQPMLALEPKG